jgi:hypothetical protein
MDFALKIDSSIKIFVKFFVNGYGSFDQCDCFVYTSVIVDFLELLSGIFEIDRFFWQTQNLCVKLSNSID